MRREDLNESIIGRRAVGYNYGKIVGIITHYNLSDETVRIEGSYPEHSWFHYKAVRLLKKKQAPVYWVSKNALEIEYADIFCIGKKLREHHNPEDFVRVKLVKLKDEK